MKRHLLLIFVSGLALLLAACNGDDNATATPAGNDDPIRQQDRDTGPAGGMGTGPAGESLDPAPAPIAHTSQMLGDDYLFWRISEGGSAAPFNSAMPTWKNILDEQQIWDTINYVQALGQEQ